MYDLLQLFLSQYEKPLKKIKHCAHLKTAFNDQNKKYLAWRENNSECYNQKDQIKVDNICQIYWRSSALSFHISLKWDDEIEENFSQALHCDCTRIKKCLKNLHTSIYMITMVCT